jgi:hypothetical protein
MEFGHARNACGYDRRAYDRRDSTALLDFGSGLALSPYQPGVSASIVEVRAGLLVGGRTIRQE